jgi:hypothetical protein
MKIETIIYETTREIYSVEDKLSIATIFLFCNEMDSKLFAELLYSTDPKEFIKDLTAKYSEYEIDFTIRLSDKNVSNSFYLTLQKVKDKYDEDGFYKALYKGDEFALVIYEIMNYDFNKIKFKNFTQKIVTQLSFNF